MSTVHDRIHQLILFFFIPDQLLQGPHQNHPLPAGRRRHLHRRPAQGSNLQPRAGREVRVLRRAGHEAVVHLGQGGDDAQHRKDLILQRQQQPEPRADSPRPGQVK